MTTRTLTGYLGADRDIRSTDSRTVTDTVWNPVAECYDPIEYTTRPRDYIRLSLATHHRDSNGWLTTWHQLVIWNAFAVENHNARLARTGDKVTVSGFVRTFIGRDGIERERFIVETFHRWPADQENPPPDATPTGCRCRFLTLLGFCTTVPTWHQ